MRDSAKNSTSFVVKIIYNLIFLIKLDIRLETYENKIYMYSSVMVYMYILVDIEFKKSYDHHLTFKAEEFFYKRN